MEESDIEDGILRGWVIPLLPYFLYGSLIEQRYQHNVGCEFTMHYLGETMSCNMHGIGRGLPYYCLSSINSNLILFNCLL